MQKRASRLAVALDHELPVRIGVVRHNSGTYKARPPRHYCPDQYAVASAVRQHLDGHVCSACAAVEVLCIHGGLASRGAESRGPASHSKKIMKNKC